MPNSGAHFSIPRKTGPRSLFWQGEGSMTEYIFEVDDERTTGIGQQIHVSIPITAK